MIQNSLKEMMQNVLNEIFLSKAFKILPFVFNLWRECSVFGVVFVLTLNSDWKPISFRSGEIFLGLFNYFLLCVSSVLTFKNSNLSDVRPLEQIL